MYILYADTKADLDQKSGHFEQYMEPLLATLEKFSGQVGNISPNLPEIQQYLQVCRWPFRKLEYSFALDILLEILHPGDRYLDAGSGVTPMAHVLAGQGILAQACDSSHRLIKELQQLQPQKVYGTFVDYTAQDLTDLSFPTASFDAISCISVLEHIPSPYDQKAVNELIRVLKPGGTLVLTVDFKPRSGKGAPNQVFHYVNRTVNLLRQGRLNEIAQAISRKQKAKAVVRGGLASQPRSANQCFEIEHLEQDILPELVGRGHEIKSRLGFSNDLRAFTAADSRQFWNMEPGLFNNQGRRTVLPAAIILRKAMQPALSGKY
jgi:ubiquinone/menaquinone biosynthesis C-methylase UbiE